MGRVILDDDDYKEVHMVIHDYIGLDFTDEQVKTFLKNESSIAFEIAEFGATDTCARGLIMNALSQRIIQKEWPTYGTPAEESDAFFKEFKEKAREYGFKVVEE